MRMLTKIEVTIFLLYAILMLFIDGLFSLLTLSPQVNIRCFIEERLIPYSVSIVSMLYCIIRINSMKR